MTTLSRSDRQKSAVFLGPPGARLLTPPPSHVISAFGCDSHDSHGAATAHLRRVFPPDAWTVVPVHSPGRAFVMLRFAGCSLVVAVCLNSVADEGTKRHP